MLLYFDCSIILDRFTLLLRRVKEYRAKPITYDDHSEASPRVSLQIVVKFAMSKRKIAKLLTASRQEPTPGFLLAEVLSAILSFFSMHLRLFFS
jgi:hypothetical protein